MGLAPASKVLGQADGLPSGPVRWQIGTMGADVWLFAVRRRSSHLHRSAVRTDGSADRDRASAVALQDWLANRQAGDAGRSEHYRAIV